MTLDYRRHLAEVGPEHWWVAGMQAASRALLGRQGQYVLDVGCGPGWDLLSLPAGVLGVGLDRQVDHVIFRPLILGDAARLPFATGTFDTVLAFDLLEQGDVKVDSVILECRRVLIAGGHLLVRVPAHPWLYGKHDQFYGGGRRFSRTELASAVVAADLKIRRLTYANGLLFPVAALTRLLNPAGLGARDLRPAPSPLNALLRELLKLEARYLAVADLPTGLSLFCLAVKEGS